MFKLNRFLAIVVAFLGLYVCARPVNADRRPKVDIRAQDGNVLIEADQILTYEWTTHTITLAPQVRDQLATQLINRGVVSGIPFAVAVDGKAIYKGTFTSMFSSQSFSTPVIVLDAQGLNSKLSANQVQIQCGYPTADFFTGKDPRTDRQILDALKASGKLAPSASSKPIVP